MPRLGSSPQSERASWGLVTSDKCVVAGARRSLYGQRGLCKASLVMGPVLPRQENTWSFLGLQRASIIMQPAARGLLASAR